MDKRKVLDAVIVFTAAVIIILFVSPYLTLYFGITGMAIAELLLAVIAVAAVLIRKDNIADRLSLRLPSIKSFFGAALLMFGTNAWQNAAAYLYAAVFGEISNNDLTFLESYFSDISPFVALISVALIPAVCEELLFRGYLLNSFKTKKGAAWAIAITALLFSVIHFDLYKLLPILVMGWAFGYIASKTGSILLPVIFHFLNNAMSLVSFYSLKNTGTEEAYMTFEGITFLWYTFAAIGIGLILVYFGTRVISGKPRKTALTVSVSVISGVVTTVGMIAMVLSMMSIPYDGMYRAQIREDTTYAETFTLDRNTIGIVTAGAMSSRDIVCSITVEDEDGNVVYDHSDPESGQGIMLEKGMYTVTYAFDIKDGTTVAYDVMATVKVMTVGEYNISETEESLT